LTYDNFMPEDEVIALFEQVSNCGRWGETDELGTLNYITPERVRAAAGLVRSGRVISIGHDVSVVPSKKNPWPAVNRMLYAGPDATFSTDQLTIVPHGFQETHLDALGHQFFEGRIYNGWSVEESMRRDGLRHGSIHAAREGIVTRGVLLDVAKARGQEWLPATDCITPDDLDAAEECVAGGVQPGDAIFVRVGVGAREAVEGPEDPAERTGLVPECIPWLHAKRVAVYSGDCFEKVPLPYQRCPKPLHQIGSAAMGLYLLDHAAVEPLARVCEEEGRLEFLTSVAPLRVPGATGSAVNPVCVF
jgi:Putative cyclase